jgi:hypothetical protein
MRWSASLITAIRGLAPLALVCAASFYAQSVNAAGASVTLNPAISTVKPGDHFRIDVVVTSDAPSRGLQLGLKFDPSLVQIDRVQTGPFYASWATANGGQAANPVPFRPNNNTGNVPPGAVVIIGGPASGGPAGSGAALTLQMTARDNVNGRAPVEISTGVISSVQAQSIPNVVQTGGLVFVGIDRDGSTPRSGPLVDIAAPPPDILPAQPSNNSSAMATSPPAIALIPTLDPAVIAGSASKPVDVAPTAAAQPTQAPVTAATPLPPPAEPPQQAPQPAPQQPPPAPPPPLQQVPPATTPVVGLLPTPAPAAPAPADVAPPSEDATPSAQAPASPVPAVVNAPQQVNLLATMSTLATAQAVPVARTPTPAAVPANGVRPVSSPVPRGQTSFAAPVIRPTASSGLFIPWEVLAGVGGGLISAAIVLYAFRRPVGGPP